MSTHYIQCHDKTKKNFLNIELSEEFRTDSKNEFELALTNELSLFELLWFDCTHYRTPGTNGLTLYELHTAKTNFLSTSETMADLDQPGIGTSKWYFMIYVKSDQGLYFYRSLVFQQH